MRGTGRASLPEAEVQSSPCCAGGERPIRGDSVNDGWRREATAKPLSSFLSSFGLALGLLGALAGGQVIAGALHGVSPRDPIAITAAVAILLGAAVLAVLGPARRAARVDPVAILRHG